jgi:glycosyltransferase involved in cell wall biosynthesis
MRQDHYVTVEEHEPLRVLAISPYVPYPGIDHAGGNYLLDYLAVLAKRCSVTLFAPADETNRARVAEAPVATRLVPMRRPYPAPLRKLETWTRGLTPGGHILRGLQGSPDLTQQIHSVDVIEIHWGYLLGLIPWLTAQRPHAAVAVHGHDVISQSLARRASMSAGGLERALRQRRARRVTRLEGNYLNRADLGYYFSDKDVELLRQMGVRIPLRVLDPNLTDPGPAAHVRRSPCEVLFVGALHRPENAQGVEWFIDTVWPRVTQRVPSARFIVAGANPPASLLDRQSGSISVTGYVSDLTAAYASAAVFVAPLLSGAGLKFKVAQAMLYALPVVTTDVGAEGFPENDVADLLPVVTRNATAMADAIVRLLENPELRADYGRRGRAWALSRFSFESGVDAVVQDYLDLARPT